MMIKPYALKSAIAVYLGQATAAAIIGWLQTDPFFVKLAFFSAGVAAINIVFLFGQWVFRRLAS